MSSVARRLLVPTLVVITACDATLTGPSAPSLAAPAPGALPVDPPIQCREQQPDEGTAITVRGAGFSPITVDVPNDPHVVLPSIALRGAHDLFGADASTGDVVYSGTPGGENGALLSWQSDTEMRFLFKNAVSLAGAPAAVPAGLYDVEVANADAQAATTALAFAVVDRPTVTALAPPLTCLEQGARSVTVEGAGALRIGELLPIVTVGGVDVAPALAGLGACNAVAHPGIDAELCDALTVELAQDALPPGAHAVTILNPAPAACTSTDVVELVVVPAPTITAVEPPTVCTADAGVLDLTVSGTGFLRVDDADFSVSIGGIAVVPSSISGCSDVAVAGLAVQTCDTFVVSVDAAAYPVGPVEVVVTNPAPADCAATTSALFEILPSPVIETVSPPSACALDGGVLLTVGGSSFVRDVAGGVDFTVAVGGVPAVPANIGGCTPIVVQGAALESCTSFEVSVDPSTFVAGAAGGGGFADITVVNAAPDLCGATRGDLFEVLPSPSIATVSPAAICTVLAGVTDLVVEGADFVRAPGADFTVTVGGAAVVPSAITGCTDVVVAGATLSTCTGFVVSVDATTFPVGPVEIVVTNPAPDGCIGSTSGAFAVQPPPTVTAVVPDEVCSDVVTSVSVVGTNLVAGTSVDFGGIAPDTVTLNADGSLTVSFSNGLPAGAYDVTVSNGVGCESTLPAAITVNPTPLVFFVDPPFIFNGITFEATLFASGVDTTVAAVTLIDAAGVETEVTTFASPGRPERILATIEAGLAPGEYEVAVTSADGCPSSLNGRLRITDVTTLTIDSVDPAFVSPTVPTAITVVTSGAVTLQNLPRVYLNPVAGGNAIALRAVELTSPTQLSAIVTGAAPGAYQLIVVNPTGEVGIAPIDVVVTAVEPPLVTSVAPASLDAGSVADVIVNGASFDVVVGPTVALDCRDFATGADVPDGTAVVAVATSTATSLDVTVDATDVAAGAVCVVVVTNPDNASFRFSALSFKNPAQNLNEFRAGSAMIEPRRGLVLAAGRPTETSRFLYAVGGDDGTAAGAKTSVEAVSVDPFGVMGTWSPQRNDLSNAFDGAQTASLPRTFPGVARVGRFVYVVGGDDGTGAQSTVLRAQILDPLAGPEILDLDAQLGDGVIGMPEGLFQYRVSALFPTSDPSNPGGESLAGELFNVEVPQVDDLLLLTLTWSAVPGASGYRIYRTPGPNQSAADLQLLAEVQGGAALSFIDNDTLTTDAAVTPQPLGSLGVWHALPTSALSIPRAAHATLAVAAPTAGQFFLYAVGGRTTGGTVVASGEVATITVAADGAQSVTPFRPLTASLAPARAELVGLSISGADTPVAGGGTFLFFSSGRRQNGQVDNTVQGAAIGATGDIAAFTANLSDPNPARVGAAGLSANGFLYLFGGANGGSSNNDVSTVLVNATPTLDNWNGLGGGGTLQPRVSLAAAAESAFFFVGGGFGPDPGSGIDGPVATIDQTIQ